MRRLHEYRYCASRYFRSKPSREKEDLKKALDELVNIRDNKIDYDYFYKKEKTEEKGEGGFFSEKDMPRENQSMKKCYDVLMKVIESYFNKIRKRSLFLQLRAYIANHFKNK
jgi:coproporphyrinogen III oxidase